MSLDFDTLRQANISRCARWHPRGLNEWSLSDWACATGGELGEAMNIVKKLNRERDGIAGNTLTEEELRRELADELADVAIYLDIWAASEGICHQRGKRSLATLAWRNRNALLRSRLLISLAACLRGRRGEPTR